jgi:hypothetical protein
MNGPFVFLATFLAATIEGVEMAAILVGVGTARGWRSTVLGAVAGFKLFSQPFQTVRRQIGKDGDLTQFLGRRTSCRRFWVVVAAAHTAPG